VFDPCDVSKHDNTHALYVDDIASLVAHLLFETFVRRSMQIVYQVFADYVSNWRWPARV
jgi:hypothetical protein